MRNEYPRPEFERHQWMSLNGTWDFYIGQQETKRREIQVPFVCQSELSGIGERISQDYVVYERTFMVSEEWRGKVILLHFGAVDYGCRVYVNGQFAGEHTGGQTPFQWDIAPYLCWKEERVRVEVWDPLTDETIPRGKQYWKEKSEFIWYTPSTGIWQSVWLEPVGRTRFDRIWFTPDIDEGIVTVDYMLAEGGKLPCEVELEITLDPDMVYQGTMECLERRNTIALDVFQKKALAGAFHFTGNYWSPENPVLYQVTARLRDGTEILDEVKTYFGMRKIHIEEGRIYLNNQPYYQKLVLDQGYWKESLVTAPSDEAYVKDIQMAKAMGFNGCRKHEKVEDPRFLYWADRLGFLVWEAMSSFWFYTPEGAEAFAREWIDVIRRDYNHPSIVVWGMLNESWGVQRIYSNSLQQSYARSLYHLAHSLDPARLVISNDGWEMVDTDICAVHSYKHGEKDDVRQQEIFRESLKSVSGLPRIVEKLPFARGYEYEGQPVVLTEFGGISIASKNEDDGSWGYTSVSQEEFLEEYARVLDAVYESDLIQGYCYTQLTDVEQEMNGLLDYEHKYKFDPARIKQINDKKG